MNKYKNNKKSIKLSLVAILLVISIGYALLNANLTINGTSNFARTTWNIHFENLVPNTNMTLGTNDSAAAITQNKTNEVTYALTFTEPGDFYEFTVDAKNDGTIDGMVNAVTSTIKIGNGEATPITTNPSNLPAYLSYTATYSDGTPIEQYHLLAANTKETYKVRVAFRTDIENTDLPGTDQSIELTFGVEYVQKNSNGIPVPHPVTTYTSNVFDNNDTTIDDGTNTSVIWLGQAMPNGITTYQTPELAMDALKQASQATGGLTDRPFFLKHTITNNIVTESYVGFVVTDEMAEDNPGMTAGTYYLKGKKTSEYVNGDWQCMPEYDDGNGNCVDPDYNTNKANLLSAFGSSYCDDYSSYLDCNVPFLAAIVDSSGYIRVGDSAWYCRVNDYGYSECDDYS